MTNEEFCKLDTEFYGEEVDHIEQIALRSFNGYELKEYVEHCIKLYSLTLPDADKRKELTENSYWLNLQNLSGREPFDKAFRLGIMTGIDELTEWMEEDNQLQR